MYWNKHDLLGVHLMLSFARVAHTALDVADVGCVQIGALTKGFLGELLLLADGADVAAQGNERGGWCSHARTKMATSTMSL